MLASYEKNFLLKSLEPLFKEIEDDRREAEKERKAAMKAKKAAEKANEKPEESKEKAEEPGVRKCILDHHRSTTFTTTVACTGCGEDGMM